MVWFLSGILPSCAVLAAIFYGERSTQEIPGDTVEKIPQPLCQRGDKGKGIDNIICQRRFHHSGMGRTRDDKGPHEAVILSHRRRICAQVEKSQGSARSRDLWCLSMTQVHRTSSGHQFCTIQQKLFLPLTKGDQEGFF